MITEGYQYSQSIDVFGSSLKVVVIWKSETKQKPWN